MAGRGRRRGRKEKGSEIEGGKVGTERKGGKQGEKAWSEVERKEETSRKEEEW